jgi:hypothetical protein
VYFASQGGYTPFEQVAMVGPDAVLTYSEMATEPTALLTQPSNYKFLTTLSCCFSLLTPLNLTYCYFWRKLPLEKQPA